jgi:hypothetical protein
MNSILHPLRARRTTIASILLALILFNALVCSLGHGLMSQAYATQSQRMEMAGHHAMAGLDDHQAMDVTSAARAQAGATSTLPDDCAFAATLTLALMFFVALGWMQRSRPVRSVLRPLWHPRPTRHSCCGLNPQAP